MQIAGIYVNKLEIVNVHNYLIIIHLFFSIPRNTKTLCKYTNRDIEFHSKDSFVFLFFLLSGSIQFLRLLWQNIVHPLSKTIKSRKTKKNNSFCDNCYFLVFSAFSPIGCRKFVLIGPVGIVDITFYNLQTFLRFCVFWWIYLFPFYSREQSHFIPASTKRC